MSLEELEKNIQIAEQTLEEERAKAEAALSAFLESVGNQLQSWFPTRVKLWVTEQSEVTKRLGARLSDLKKEVGPTSERFPEMVRKWLGSDQLWRHRPGYKNEPKNYYQRDYSASGNSGPKQIDEPLEQQLGFFVREFATRYGYKDVHHIGVTWKDLQSSLAAYAASYEAFSVAMRKHENAIEAKKRHEAALLWEEA